MTREKMNPTFKQTTVISKRAEVPTLVDGRIVISLRVPGYLQHVGACRATCDPQILEPGSENIEQRSGDFFFFSSVSFYSSKSLTVKSGTAVKIHRKSLA